MTALVIGNGPMSLLTAIALAQKGVERIVVTGRSKEKNRLVQRLGDVLSSDGFEIIPLNVREISEENGDAQRLVSDLTTSRGGVDMIFAAANSDKVVEPWLPVMAQGGAGVLLYGATSELVAVPSKVQRYGGFPIINSRRQVTSFGPAVEALQMAPAIYDVISSEGSFPIASAEEVFQKYVERRTPPGKITFTFEGWV